MADARNHEPEKKKSLTCCKSATWDRRLYFPSKGRRADDFSPEKSKGFGWV
jgi:hypothetical protein